MSEAPAPKLCIFLSAYACEPGKGSEPGVGWRWANGLASEVDLTVLTRESNRGSIDRAVGAAPEDAAIRRVKFVYHDLSKPWLSAKRRGWLPTFIYYVFWQFSVARKFRQQADRADVVHHLTFCTLLCPGFWKLDNASFVLGPVGAPLVNPHYYALFGRKRISQRARGALMIRFLRLPWLRRLLRSARAVIPANSETRELLLRNGITPTDVMLDTGPPGILKEPCRNPIPGKLRLIYAGQLERRKGLELAIRALATIKGDRGIHCTFDLFGSGPDEARLRRLVDNLGLNADIHFHGSVPQIELAVHFERADAFVFPSVRDTSGGVNLEAMSQGLPVVCIAHHGIADITDGSCAERIAPADIPHTIAQLAAAFRRLATDTERRMAMGASARERAQQFGWPAKVQTMCCHYREALSRRNSHH